LFSSIAVLGLLGFTAFMSFRKKEDEENS
jgi:hypothetical protein